ncbi:MAG: hypothetical protein AAGM67_08845, partial [Bacteroidota bacterium]
MLVKKALKNRKTELVENRGNFLVLLERWMEALFVSTTTSGIKDDVNVKPKISVILPIALALLLPGLSLYTNEQNNFPSTSIFYTVWALSSVV